MSQTRFSIRSRSTLVGLLLCLAVLAVGYLALQPSTPDTIVTRREPKPTDSITSVNIVNILDHLPADEAQPATIISLLDSIPTDSTRLRQCYKAIQNYLNQPWCTDIIDYALAESERQDHLLWLMAFHGCKVRWGQRCHDWEFMHAALMEQRAKAFERHEFGNYISQIGQAAIVMAERGEFERSWQYIQMMGQDMIDAGQETLDTYDIYNYLVKAEYYKNKGNKQQRSQLLISAYENNIRTNPLQRSQLHLDLAGVFLDMGEYDKALAHADSVYYIYLGFSADRQSLPLSRTNISEANIKKVDIYNRLGQYDNMYRCLQIADEYATLIAPTSVADVNRWWSKYYLGIGQYQQSLDYLDEAVAIYREHQSEDKATDIELDKLYILSAMDCQDSALCIAASLLNALDSVQNSMITEQQDYLTERTEILNQRIESERINHLASKLVAIIAGVALLFVASMLIYAMRIRRRLRHNYRITTERLEQAKRADTEKARFLSNITTLINTPLQMVVSNAKHLSNDTALTPEERTQLVATNNQHVRHLLQLVNNVLDLSRLEAEMMRYNNVTVDVVKAIKNFIDDYNLHNLLTPIRATYNKRQFVTTVDPERMVRIVESLFTTPLNCRVEPSAQRAVLFDDDANNCLVITVRGSVFAYPDILTEVEAMTNSINRLVCRDFGASYTITPQHDIVITLRPIL